MSSFEWTFCVCLLTCLLNWSVSGGGGAGYTEDGGDKDGGNKDGGNIDRVKSVQPGGDVLLPCQGPRGADIIFVQWIRPELESEGSVFFFRDNHTYENYQHPSFHGRVELRDPEMKDGDASVILKNINIKDTGKNDCYVRIKGSRSELINSVYIKCEQQDQQITVKTGDDVTLQCLDHRGGDIELLEWRRREKNVFVWKHGKMREDLQHPSFKNRVELRDPEMKDGDVSVILKNININDAGTFECRVRNSNTQAPPQLITTSNLAVTDLGKSVQPGGDVLLLCQGPRGADIVFVQWIRPDLKSEGSVFFFRDDRAHENYQHPSFHGRVELRDPQMKDGDASVILKNVNIKDTGTYECYVRIKGSKPQLINSIYIKYVHPDQQITVKTGDDVTLQCLGPRGGDIELLEWRRQDQVENVLVWKYGKMCEDPQHPSFKNRVELRDPEMKDGDVSGILKNVTINDAGTYQCLVGNSNTTFISNIKLTVIDSGGDKDGGDRVGLIFGLSLVIVLAVFLVAVGFTMYRKSKRLKMQIHHPPADEADEPELQDMNPEPVSEQYPVCPSVSCWYCDQQQL